MEAKENGCVDQCRETELIEAQAGRKMCIGRWETCMVRP